MDVMALQCRSCCMAVLPMQSHAVQIQRGGRLAVLLKLRKLSLARCNAVSGGARCAAGPPSDQFQDGYFSESVLSGNPILGGSAKSGGRDWRVYSSGNASGQRDEDGGRWTTRLNATVEKANDAEATQEKNIRMFGSSEASCDENSSYLAVESILENEGGKSVEDYKLRAHIFSESDIFFTALKDRNCHSVN